MQFNNNYLLNCQTCLLLEKISAFSLLKVVYCVELKGESVEVNFDKLLVVVGLQIERGVGTLIPRHDANAVLDLRRAQVGLQFLTSYIRQFGVRNGLKRFTH